MIMQGPVKSLCSFKHSSHHRCNKTTRNLPCRAESTLLPWRSTSFCFQCWTPEGVVKAGYGLNQRCYSIGHDQSRGVSACMLCAVALHEPITTQAHRGPSRQKHTRIPHLDRTGCFNRLPASTAVRLLRQAPGVNARERSNDHGHQASSQCAVGSERSPTTPGLKLKRLAGRSWPRLPVLKHRVSLAQTTNSPPVTSPSELEESRRTPHSSASRPSGCSCIGTTILAPCAAHIDVCSRSSQARFPGRLLWTRQFSHRVYSVHRISLSLWPPTSSLRAFSVLSDHLVSRLLRLAVTSLPNDPGTKSPMTRGRGLLLPSTSSLSSSTLDIFNEPILKLKCGTLEPIWLPTAK